MATQHIGCERGWTWNTDQRLEVIDCGSCHIRFAIPEGMADKVQADGEWFYCPNGDRIHYHETEVKRLRREAREAKDAAARARAQRDQARARAEAEARQARAEKAAKTRIRNSRERERKRVQAGVCPCCNRTFKNLGRHMQSQHPDHVHAGPV
jgi:hypothetical protein